VPLTPMAGAPPSAQSTHALEEAPGLRCFTLSLWQVQWPPKFRLEMPSRYDGAVDPAPFLQAYEEADCYCSVMPCCTSP